MLNCFLLLHKPELRVKIAGSNTWQTIAKPQFNSKKATGRMVDNTKIAEVAFFKVKLLGTLLLLSSPMLELLMHYA
jgi:hypothetical protein